MPEPTIGEWFAWAIKLVVGWIAPLATLLYEFVFALRLLRAAKTRETRLSARAGLIVGMAIWLYVAYRNPPGAILFTFPTPVGNLWQLVYVVGGFAAGYLFVSLVRRWAETAGVGVLTLLLVASSWTAAYSYVFVSAMRDFLFTTSLFLLIGAAFHVIVRAKHVAEIVVE